MLTFLANEKSQQQGTLNKAIRRIIRDCNDMQVAKNIKVIQELCGYTCTDVTLDIYTTVTKELELRKFGDFAVKMKQQKKEWEKMLTDTSEGGED